MPFFTLTTAKTPIMKLYTDGYTLIGNPSPKGGGFTVVNKENKLLIHERIEKEGLTNNEAELRGLNWALKEGKTGDEISTDSNVVLSWLRRGKTKARKDLNELIQECVRLKKEKSISLIWEGRDSNLAGIYNEFTLMV